jgi:predicted nucleic acid-binding protein
VRQVIDASIALGWHFEDERTEAVDLVLERVTEDGAIVPVLWRLEVANGFRTALRKKRISLAFRDEALRSLAKLPISLDPETGAQAWTETLALADRFDLTLYDAAYLELAWRRTLPLATLDGGLRAAGQALGVALLGA